MYLRIEANVGSLASLTTIRKIKFCTQADEIILDTIDIDNGKNNSKYVATMLLNEQDFGRIKPELKTGKITFTLFGCLRVKDVNVKFYDSGFQYVLKDEQISVRIARR